MPRHFPFRDFLKNIERKRWLRTQLGLEIIYCKAQAQKHPRVGTYEIWNFEYINIDELILLQLMNSDFIFTRVFLKLLRPYFHFHFRILDVDLEEGL